MKRTPKRKPTEDRVREDSFDPRLSQRLDCVLFLEEHENDPKWQKFLNDYRTRLEKGIHAD